MVPARSRREFLQATAFATAAALAGCTVRYNPDDKGSDGRAQRGTATQSPVPHGTPYTVEVRNFITSDALTAAEVPEAPASVTIEVQTERDGATETIFEESIEVPPDGVRSLEDVFATEADGPTYELRALLEPFPHQTDRRRAYSAVERLNPGGYGEMPTGTTFGAVVADSADERTQVEPYVALYRPKIYQRLKEEGEPIT